MKRLLVVALVACGSKESSAPAPEPAKVAPVPVMPPPVPVAAPPVAVAIDVTAKQLFADYDANELGADEKYKGKTLRISGTVSSIGKDITGTAYVQFAIGDPVYGVQCMFNDASGLSSLKKGQQLVVRCKEPGKMGNVVLSDCVTVPAEPASEIPAPKSAEITVDTTVDGPQPAEVQKRLAGAASDIWNYCRAAVVDGDRFHDLWHTAAVSIGRNSAVKDRDAMTFIVKATFDDRRRSVHRGATAAYEVDSKLTKIRPMDESSRLLCGLKALDWSKIDWK